MHPLDPVETESVWGVCDWGWLDDRIAMDALSIATRSLHFERHALF